MLSPPATTRQGALINPTSILPCYLDAADAADAALNPHTEIALAAYSKSPYPQCSASTILPPANLYQRSTVDTALLIYRQFINLANADHP